MLKAPLPRQERSPFPSERKVPNQASSISLSFPREILDIQHRPTRCYPQEADVSTPSCASPYVLSSLSGPALFLSLVEKGLASSSALSAAHTSP